MNRLERQVVKAADDLASKHGRCSFVLVLEPDGVNPHGINYALHCTAADETSPAAFLLMSELNKHYTQILHTLLQK